MKFTTRERLWLRELLPVKGTFSDMKLKRELALKIEFSDEEKETLELKRLENGLSFNPQKEFDSELEFNDDEKQLIKNSLNMLSEKKELTDDLVTLFEKFM